MDPQLRARAVIADVFPTRASIVLRGTFSTNNPDPLRNWPVYGIRGSRRQKSSFSKATSRPDCSNTSLPASCRQTKSSSFLARVMSWRVRVTSIDELRKTMSWVSASRAASSSASNTGLESGRELYVRLFSCTQSHASSRSGREHASRLSRKSYPWFRFGFELPPQPSSLASRVERQQSGREIGMDEVVKMRVVLWQGRDLCFVCSRSIDRRFTILLASALANWREC